MDSISTFNMRKAFLALLCHDWQRRKLNRRLGEQTEIHLTPDCGRHTATRIYRARNEMKLDPEAVTYWRSLDGAGIPPVFSFEASGNAARIAVFFPLRPSLMKRARMFSVVEGI